MHKLKGIKRLNKYLVNLKWDDGLDATVKIAALRKACPCEDCGIARNNPPNPLALPVIKNGEFEIEKVEPIGNYALKFTYKDGHDGGYYTWDLLREICEANALPPDEIERLEAAANSDPTPQSNHCSGDDSKHDPDDPRCCHDLPD
jgi:DUF971 family protein